jgi:hypothetical protein
MKIYLVFKCSNVVVLDRDEDFDLDLWTAIHSNFLEEIGVVAIKWRKV